MKKLALWVGSWVWAASCFAGPQVGTLAEIQGEVQIFSFPSAKILEGPAPHVKFEGMYYSASDGKVGDRIEKGSVVRTSPDAKALIIFDNGDQFHVAPATSFRVTWDKDTDDAHSEMEIRYGKLRAVIEKRGPRSRFKIRTQAAVIGVRGTDFFVAVGDEVTETATLRGSVEVVPQIHGEAEAAPKAEFVNTGQTASVSKTGQVEFHPTTQDEFKAVTRNSEIAPTQAQQTPPEVAEKIHTLQEAASATTLKDIRNADPELAGKFEAAPASATVMNQAVVAQLEQKAPSDQHPPGPIANIALEKGENKTVEKVEEGPHVLPSHRLWVGIRFGTGPTHADVNGTTTASYGGPCGGNNQPPCTSNIYNNGSTNGTQIALQAQYGLFSDFSVLGEFLPYVSDGAVGNFGVQSYCFGPGPCNNGYNGFDEVELKSVRFNGLFVWSPALFGSQRFGLDLGAGPGINILTRARYPHNNQPDITDSFNKLSLLINAGAGLHERIGDNWKVLAQFRWAHSLTNMVNSSGVFVDGSSFKILESSVGVALQYGL